MNRKDLVKKINTLILTLMLTISMSGFALEEVFAGNADTGDTQISVQAEVQDSRTDSDANGADSGILDNGTGSTDDESGPSADSTISDNETEADSGNEAADGDAANDSSEPSSDESGDNAGEDHSQDPEDSVITITVSENHDGTMKLTWEPVEGAAVYIITKEACSAYNTSQKFDEGQTDFETAAPEFTFTDLYLSRLYSFTVTAKDSEGNVLAETADPAAEQPVITPPAKKSRASRTVGAAKMTFANGGTNLRSYIGEGHSGYAVVQGGCTDGTYAYYLMVSSYNQHGRIAKVRMSDKALVKVSGVLDIWHGNGMTYDSKRHQLIVSSRDEPENGVYRKQQLTAVSADSLTIISGRQKNVGYTYFASDKTNFTSSYRGYGIASIAYSAKYDVYIADQRESHNLMVIDPDTYEAMGMIRTTITSKYPGVYQGMDADDQYAYMLLSSNGSNQPNNLILALDWNASQLTDSEGHRRQFVPEAWNCSNGRTPVAVYKLNTSYEAENIYHTTDAAGNTHFYLSEYFANQQYTTQKVQEPYQVKWKKVKKKVKVAYKVKKRVKTEKYKTKKGKWKWRYKTIKVTKYKWKKKKVWLYKTKYRTVTKTVPWYKDRVANVYDLGVI